MKVLYLQVRAALTEVPERGGLAEEDIDWKPLLHVYRTVSTGGSWWEVKYWIFSMLRQLAPDFTDPERTASHTMDVLGIKT